MARAHFSGMVMVLTVLMVPGCDAPTPQPAVCAAYEVCYLSDGGAGLKVLAETAASDVETACYASYGTDGADALIAELDDAYGADGLCFAGGLHDASGNDVSAQYVTLCSDYCRLELEADCRRQRTGSTSICDDPCGSIGVAAAIDSSTLASCVVTP